MKLHKFWAAVGTALAVFAPAIAVVVAPSAQAQTYSVLHTFRGWNGGQPYPGLIQDRKGNLYGSTELGGTYRHGVVFRLEANGKYKVLYSFTGGADGATPAGGLVRDPAGNLYGTTYFGGAYGNGVVFQLSPGSSGWTETVLYSFTGGADGSSPTGSLVRDPTGNLYGTTSDGGAYDRYGVVFKLSPSSSEWTETVLYSFTGKADGEYPNAGLLRDSTGDLYGTTLEGGTGNCSGNDRCGVVFKLSPGSSGWTESVLYSFTGGVNGGIPLGSLVRDSAGNLYGATSRGGDMTGCYRSGCGVVFKLWANSKYNVLHRFTGGADGAYPSALVRDSGGSLYGTTGWGGDMTFCAGSGCGAVFKLSRGSSGWTETVLYSFTGGADGTNPEGLLRDSAGNLYGPTYRGGDTGDCSSGCGVVFKITPQ